LTENLGSFVTPTSNSKLHFFDGYHTISSADIDVNDENFTATYSHHIGTMLLRFNGKFVSGGYNTDYSSTNLYAFGDWTSAGGYALNGFDYTDISDSGVNGFKWIAIDVTSKRISRTNRVVLSGFKINGNTPILTKFGYDSDADGYEAYISHNGQFGALDRALNPGGASWFEQSNNNNVTDAKANNGALQSNLSDSSVYDAFINVALPDTTTIYLVVGLPQNMNSYFTFT